MLVLAACSGPPGAPAVTAATPQPHEVSGEIERAAIWGRALYDSYSAAPAPATAPVEAAVATAQAAPRDLCTGAAYRAVVVQSASAPVDTIVVYVIGEPVASKEIMIGRHYRVEVSGDGRTVKSIVPSTKSCITLGSAPSGTTVVGGVVTHILSPTPTEFHVFASLLHGVPISVGTRTGIWDVDGDKIHFVEEL
jgi:hypothetical protein